MTDPEKSVSTHASGEAGMKGRLAKGTAYMAGAKFFTLAMGLISTIVLARFLSPSDFGLVAIATALIMIFSQMSELSLSEALVQIKDPTEGHYDTAWTMNVLRSLILGSLIAILAYPISQMYSEDRLINILFVLVLVPVIGGFSNPKMAVYLRRLDFKQMAFVAFIEKFAAFITGITIAVIFHSYWALIIGIVVSQFIRTIATYSMIRYRPRWSLSAFREIIGFSVWVSLSGTVRALSHRSDDLILGYFISVSQLGQFSMGKRVVSMASQELMSPLRQVLFPAFSRVKDDPVRLSATYLKAISIITSIAFPIAGGLGIISGPLVALALGEKWLPVVPIIQVLCGITILNSMQMVHAVAMATGNTKALFERNIRIFFIRLPLLFLGIYVGHKAGFGYLYGALLGSVLSAIVNSIWNMHLLTQISSINFANQIKYICRPLLATIIMVAIVYYFQRIESFQSWVMFVQVMASVVVGVGAYVSSLALSWLVSGRPEGSERLVFKTIELSLKIFRK